MKKLLLILAILTLSACGERSEGVAVVEKAGIKTVFTTASPPAPLPRTGQTICYDGAGATISCSGTGQDGELQAGVAWPSPRFTDNGDQSITDNLTGLIWTKDANLMKTRDPLFTATYDGAGFPIPEEEGAGATWQQALDYVKKLNSENYLGHNDWRLPNINELAILVNRGQTNQVTWLNSQGFSNVQSSVYWSGSTYASYTNGAWVVSMSDGSVDSYYGNKANSRYYYVWPVRAGQSGSFGYLTLPKTGQTNCYNASGATISCSGTGQDGELQTGTAWPTPRFTDNSLSNSTENTVTDNLTGLIWCKNANLAVATKTWQQALDYIKSLNNIGYAGHNDWRLPNSNELASLVSRGQSNSATWLNGQGFSNVQYYPPYWSGSIYADNLFRTYAWYVYMEYGYTQDTEMTVSYYVWPVRGGQTGSSASFTLSVVKSGTGSGTVTSSTGGISCGSNCSSIYTPNSSVTLTATASNGSTFTGWSGSCSGTGTCTVTMDAGKSVTAAFTIATPTATLTKSKVFMGAGDDFVTASNSGMTVYGNTGNDIVTINSAVTDVFLDQNVERIIFNGASGSYTFMQTGNLINVYDAYFLVRSPVQDDSDGTLLSFSDGTASAILLTGGVMKLGGAIVNPVTASTLNPVFISGM
ncbi:MAG: DUF1566 domain-containing protein [Desulfuromonadaceae bacterium]|nr:DUF1566 domain-containing protein [Desulfuromonadaceae bacterium]